MNDYYQGNRDAKIKIHSPDFEEDEIEVSWYFRQYDDMPEIEKKALDLCQGKIIDIGAGAGSHALYLQKKGMDVTALDISGGACEIMRMRGVKKVLQEDIFTYKEEKYDTSLMLMNGIGVTGSIENLDIFLDSLNDLLNPGGQLLFDSTNLIYLYSNDQGEEKINLNDDYYGQVQFRMEYDDFFTRQFSWIYIDFDTLAGMAEEKGLKAEKIMDGENYHYLGRISI
mgnify:FL=1